MSESVQKPVAPGIVKLREEAVEAPPVYEEKEINQETGEPWPICPGCCKRHRPFKTSPIRNPPFTQATQDTAVEAAATSLWTMGALVFGGVALGLALRGIYDILIQ